MPAHKKGTQEYRTAKFRRMYKVAKARTDLTDSTISQAMGLTRNGLIKSMQTPERMPIERLRLLCIMFSWTPEDLAFLFE